jgi:hypothetical protein
MKRTCLQRFDWSWRLAASVFLTFGVMAIFFGVSTMHFDILRQCSDIFANVGKIEQVLGTAENFQR